MTIDLKELVVSVIGALAWLSVIGVFIARPDIFLLSAVALFWLRGYVDDCRIIPVLTITVNQQE